MGIFSLKANIVAPQKGSYESPGKGSNVKIVVTGASGLLGATCLAEWRSQHQIHGTYLTHPIKMEAVSCKPIDLSQGQHLKSYLDEISPQIIVHTAAATNIDACEKDHALAYKSNVEATKNLAEYAGKHGLILVHISTDAFFDGDRYFTEEDLPHPVNYYGETKLLAEEEVRKNCPHHLIIRTNLYGWNYQDKQSLAEWMLINLAQNRPIPLVHDVIYTPILTNRLARAALQLLEKKATGTFNIAGTRGLSKLEFGQALCKIFNLSPKAILPSSVKDLKLEAKRANSMPLSTEKFRKLLPGALASIEEDLELFKELYFQGYPQKLKGRPFQIPDLPR